MFWLGAVIFCLGIYLNDAGYGTGHSNYFMTAAPGDGQSDAQAPAYMPAYLRELEQNSDPSGANANEYSGTKNSYAGTKNSYGGERKKIYNKNTRGTTKIVYTGTKNGYGGAGSYSNVREWESSDTGSMPQQSYFNYHQMAKSYAPKCEPDCKNSGICVAENTCNCPQNFHGTYCEFEKIPCLNYPPLPMNAHRKCDSESCTIHCLEGHRFIDGTTVANMRCAEGKWVPSRADLTIIPDCQPECDPPCLNGGVCLSLNTCQCPAKYRGPECQYSASACDVRKLSFNGGYKCLGDDATQKCKLSCPAGSEFSATPADVYTCRYDSGVFMPQPIPHCVFTEVVVITPSNQHNTSFYTYHSGVKGGYNETVHYESHSESYGSYGSGMSSYGSGSSGYGSGSSGYGSGSSIYGSGSSGYGGGSSQHTGGSSSYGSGSGGYGSSHTGGSSVQVIMQDLTPKGGTCLTWAGAHYKTFDGTVYTFQSPCQHVLVREPKEHKYSVVIRQSECKRPGYCPSELSVYLQEKLFTLSVGEDGSVLFRNTKRLIPIPASLPGIRVSMPGDYVVVNLDAVGVAIKWDTNNLVQIEGSILLWNNTEGLCGLLDGNPANDLMTKDGAVVQSKFVVASSWKLNKIGDICETSPTETAACATETADDVAKATKFCNDIISMKKFRKCSKVMDVLQFLDACKWDYCACSKTLNSDECACKAISVYAKECLRHDVEEMKSWRDPETCPMKCPEGKIYKSCGADSQPSCAFPLISTKSESVCVEGCFCPEGLLLEAGRCVQKKECSCRLRNKSFPPGHVIKKDCNTCSCEAGSWVCTKIPCGARCRAVGDPHYTTFDGLRYDFMGQCTYTMLQAENVTVLVENVACSGAITEQMNLTPYKGQGKPSCTKAVTVTYDGAKIQLKQLGAVFVNDNEISTLPVMVGDVRIRYASSLFIIVQLPIKVDLWWDGNTRVFIDVPPAFHDKTKGLCGTFNLNQKDDFLTPENDVEQSTGAFANKWRTREFCQEMSVEEPVHPCTANVENKQQAENYCAKLKGKVFEACHWHVDVEPYYESCLYDMCACQGDAARCLCPILGDYAMTCAKAGVIIQWRYNVNECELSCTGGQEYTVCADSCLRKCSDSAISACEPSCVEGCACPQGQLLDDSGVCVPIALCPCFHKGLEFKAGYKEVRAGRRERELCTCVGAKWDCTPATPDQIQNYPPAEDLRTNCSATQNMEFTTCARTEHLTCKNMHLPPSPLAAECRPGCQCSSGYVLDTASSLCVLPARCPCHHAGTSFPDGHHMTQECNQCVCKGGNWSCTDIKCAGVCAAWGDSHMVTFDGTDYDFEGVCTYLLAKGVMDDRDGFDVEIQNVPCGTTGATCSKSITLKVGTGNSEEIVSLTKNAPLPDISKLKRIKLRLAGAYVFLDVPSLGMSLQWDKEMRVHVKVDSMWQGRVKGLCGNYNGDMRDDFQTPSGGGLAESSPLIFADSWKLKPTCPKPLRIIDHCKQRPERKEWAATTCGTLKRYPFTLCHGEVPAGPYVDRCERDACACDSGGDCQCACAALAEYAHVCARRGVAVKWRTQELCPMQCDEECSNYDPCVSACPIETCDNVLYYSEIKTNCEHDTCVEGCKPKKACPVGEVYKNGSTTVCVPIAKCKPICMTLENGTEIAEGEVLEQDDCHTCTCSKHQRICTGQPCVSDPYTIMPRYLPSRTLESPILRSYLMTREPPLIVTSRSDVMARESPATTGFTSRGIKMMTIDPPIMTSEPPMITSESQITSDPEIMTSGSPMITSASPMTKITINTKILDDAHSMTTRDTTMMGSDPIITFSRATKLDSSSLVETIGSPISRSPFITSLTRKLTSGISTMTSETPLTSSGTQVMSSETPETIEVLMMPSEPPVMTKGSLMRTSGYQIIPNDQMMSIKIPMTAESIIETSESPTIMNAPHLMMNASLTMTTDSLETSSESPVTNSLLVISIEAPKIRGANESPMMTIGRSMMSSGSTSGVKPVKSTQMMSRATQLENIVTPDMINVLPIVTSAAPIMTFRSPVMTSGSPTMNSEPLMMTSGSPKVTSGTSMITSVTSMMTSGSSIKTSGSPMMTSGLSMLTSESPVMPSGPSMITSESPMMMSGPSMITIGSPMMTSGLSMITSESPLMSSGPSMITSESPMMTSGPSMITIGSPMMTSGPSTITIASPMMTSGLSKLTSESPVISSEPSMITSESPIMTNKTPIITIASPMMTSGSSMITIESPMMTSGSSMITSESPVMSNGPSMITSESPMMTSGPSMKTIGSPTMNSEALMMTSGSAKVTSGTSMITSVTSMMTSGSSILTSRSPTMTSGLSMLTSESPVMSSGPSMITSESPMMTSGLSMITSESSVMSSGPSMSTSESPMMTSGPSMITFGSPIMTSGPSMMTIGSPIMTSDLSMITNESPVTSSGPSMITIGSPTMTSGFSMITSESSVISSGPSMTTSESPMITSESPVITSGTTMMTSRPSMITIESPMMTSGPSMITSGTTMMTIGSSMITSESPMMTSGPSMITSGSPMMTSGPSMITSGSSIMNSGSSMMTSGSSKMASGYSTITSGSPIMTSGAAVKTAEDHTITTDDQAFTNVLPILKSEPPIIMNLPLTMTFGLPEWISAYRGFIKGGGYYPFARTMLWPPPEGPETTPHPNDQGLQCVTGWSPWLSRGSPEVAANGGHLEVEPLPKVNELHIGSPMCKVDRMTSIECRTVGDHKSPKETGVDVECSLERGLVCREKTAVCPDFEIRVYCQCEAQNPCENSTIPAPHPTDCSKFIQCDGVKAVETTCGVGTLFNPHTLVCDWPAAVAAVRPECANITESTTTIPTTTITPTEATTHSPATTPTIPPTQGTPTTPTTPTIPAPRCPPGQMYSDCTYPCDKLCDHFKKTVMNRGLCAGEKCLEGCIDIAVAHIECDYGSFWRDEKTCVPRKDCTCLSEVDNKIVRPGGVVIDGCLHCQCLDNAFHCDASECVSPIPFAGPTHESLVVPRVINIPQTTEFIPDTTPTTTQKATTTLVETIRMTQPYFEEGREEEGREEGREEVREEERGEIIVIKTTVSPPPECHPDEYYDLMWGDDPLPDSAFSASSVASALFEPQYAKLNGHPLDTTAGSWNPSTHDRNQYIQVELASKEPIYGVILQGSPLFNQYVTSYEVLYGDDGVLFHKVEEAGKPKIFQGPSAANVASKQMIVPPIEAKFIRIHPLSWHDEISVRMELIGCRVPTTTETEEFFTTTEIPTLEPLQCTEPLGIAADLPLDSISVSSNREEKQFLSLDAEHAWRPLFSTPGEWVMFNFTSPRNITGIKTKGGEKGWVSSYKVLFTSNLEHFNPVLDKDVKERIFPANNDGDSEAMVEFHPPIHAQYIKVVPVKWHKVIEMRVEPIGCFEPYPTLPPTTIAPTAPTTPAACALCPGVQPPETCACAPFQYYDGENCVLRSQCPCVISFMSYPVGSTFRGANCDQCVCKLGGVTSCSPMKECTCEGPINGNLVPKLLPTTCECLCEPCPTGTKVCPHGKMCLALDKWCDGLQDCPDDELNCTTVPPPTEPPVVTTQAVTAAAMIATTTFKPIECPVVACPPGYTVQYSSTRPRNPYSYALDLPPPRPRYSYQRYYKGGGGGYTKTGFSKGGFSKGGFSKGGFSKGGFSKGGFGYVPTKPSQPFTLDKPAIATAAPPTEVQICPQFTCIPHLPPFHPPGATPAPVVCSVVTCPSGYTLKLDTMKRINKCPQYECVPPPERAFFCNITGRTFNTFDGAEYKYDVCFHILARENRFNAWTIVVRKKCRAEGCWNELLIAQDDQMILVKPNMMIEYENYEYNVEQTSKICFQKNSFDVARLGDGVSVKSRKYNFTVLFSKEGDVKIGVLKKHMGTVDGLCGAFDGDKVNDRRLPDGNLATSILQFGSAWGKPGMAADACQARVVAAAKQKRVWELCDVISHEPLSRCGSVLSLDKWRSICLEKICECSELVVNGTKRSEQECRCLLLQQMVAECLAADDGVDLAAWRIKTECPAECPAPLVHYDCFHRRCEPSCETGGLKSESSCEVEHGACYPGCYCPEGTLRRGDDCVLPQDCLDCTCNGVGSPAKYVTFEGDELPYLCNCTYLASRDRNDTGLHSYQVFATNGPCEDNPSAMCTKAVHLAFGKNVIHVSKNPDNQKLLTTVGETAVYNFPMKESWGSIVLENKQDVTITLTDSHVQLKVLASKMEFIINVASSIYANRTQGLCGVCEGYQEALITSNGTTTDNFEEYGKSWQATPSELSALSIPPGEQCDQPPPVEECVPPPAELNPCYNLYNKDRFGACHALLDPDSFVHSCEADLCANTSDSCASLERYAAACRAQGVCMEHWRVDLCPYPCDDPLIYRSCVDCERTCENYDELTANPKKCDKQPVEGCFCPEGKVRVNNTCIEPSKCFPCDANKEHYAGDEWQTSACTKCTCSKLRGSNSAHVACTTESCTTPLCSDREDVVTEPAKPGQCCATHVCVPKPKVATCVEPKKMECGYGQVLKQKTTPDGCQEFACECKPASECDTIPPDSEVEMFEPGMERLVDRSGCCPKAELVCRKDRCPGSPACQQFHDLKVKNDTEKCCPEYYCELPKDKCLVKLEWEAAAKGGEKSRTTPQIMFKELDSVWLDGPCRTCRCADGPRGAAPACDITECPAILSTEQLVLEPRPVPFACCPQPEQVACRARDNIYKVGENWTSPTDACTQYKCVRHEDGTLERVTTVQACETKCQPGWEYSSPPSEQCCGACVPVACVVGKETHRIGTVWTSEDHCANYTCLLQNGTLQIQSANVTCPEISKALQKQFVLKSNKVAGKCCPEVEVVACRVGNLIYQEGQTWQTKDPCKNMTCAREGGVLTTQVHVENCLDTCKKGWVYAPPATGACCGHCVEDSCVVKEELKKPGTTWQSPDNCTTFSCERAGEEVFVTSSTQTCPSVSECPAEFLKLEGCCQVCREPPESLSKCVPTSIPLNDTIGLVRRRMGPHGDCENKQPIAGFKECRGTCDSGAIYDSLAGVHNSACECCSAVKFSPLEVNLQCTDGSRQPHQLASPVLCACRACGAQKANFWTKSGGTKSPSHSAIKSATRPSRESEDESDFIPNVYRRFGAGTDEKK